MNRGMCNGCGSLSRISTMLAVVMVSLVLRSVKVSSIELQEEMCKPRPVVVSETEGHKPYHILVHRCSGTCNVNIPPSQKPCTAANKKEIEVPVTDPLGQNRKFIKIYNHTSCNCECNLECKWAEGERQDGKNCKCLKAPTDDTFVGGQKTEDVLPYKIGLAALGFVTALLLALFVCTKRKKVLEGVKSCCQRDPPPTPPLEAAV